MRLLEIFLTDKRRQIIGGKVSSGDIERGSSLEVFRKKEKVGKGKIVGLKRGEKEISSAKEGSECGILFEGSTTIEKGDILKTYKKEQRKAE